MGKKRKVIIGFFILIGIMFFIGVKCFIRINEIFDGATISGNIGAISIHGNEHFSEEDQEYLTKISLSKRKEGIDINSENARNLGKATNHMILSTHNKSNLESTKKYKYNLWIGENKGYIQNEESSKIYKLNSEENKFFIDAYLNYHSHEEVKSMISKDY